MTAAALDKLAGIAAGDRVRVTFEGEYEGYKADTGVYVRADEHFILGTSFSFEEVAAPTFKIEHLVPPLQIGELAQYKAEAAVSAAPFRVKGFVEDAGVRYAVVRSTATNAIFVVAEHNIERAPDTLEVGT